MQRQGDEEDLVRSRASSDEADRPFGGELALLNTLQAVDCECHTGVVGEV